MWKRFRAILNVLKMSWYPSTLWNITNILQIKYFFCLNWQSWWKFITFLVQSNFLSHHSTMKPLCLNNHFSVGCLRISDFLKAWIDNLKGNEIFYSYRMLHFSILTSSTGRYRINGNIVNSKSIIIIMILWKITDLSVTPGVNVS